jgi:hypothetical protein
MIAVSYLGGDRLHIDVRGHELSADQPVEDGGGDTAPTPTEHCTVHNTFEHPPAVRISLASGLRREPSTSVALQRKTRGRGVIRPF